MWERAQAAVPILSLTCDYCRSNLKGGKIFDKLPFGYSSEEEHHLVVFPQSRLPYRVRENFGANLLKGELRMRNTRKAVFQISYSIKDYYNNNHKSMKE